MYRPLLRARPRWTLEGDARWRRGVCWWHYDLRVTVGLLSSNSELLASAVKVIKGNFAVYIEETTAKLGGLNASCEVQCTSCRKPADTGGPGDGRGKVCTDKV